jgi:hypothetical protein
MDLFWHTHKCSVLTYINFLQHSYNFLCIRNNRTLCKVISSKLSVYVLSTENAIKATHGLAAMGRGCIQGADQVLSSFPESGVEACVFYGVTRHRWILIISNMHLILCS